MKFYFVKTEDDGTEAAHIQLSDEDLGAIIMSVLHSRDSFRSYEHDNDADNLIDIGEAAKRQEILERVFGIDDWPDVQLKNPPTE